MTKKKTTFKKNKKLSAGKIKSEVLRFFRKNPKKKLNAKSLARKLKIGNKDSVNHAMVVLHQEGALSSFKNGLYGMARRGPMKPGRNVKTFTGKVDLTRTGAAFIITDESAQDIYVPAKFVAGAIDGDRVDVMVFDFKKGRRPEGKIVKILQRAKEHFVGTIHIFKKYAVVVPDGDQVPFDIHVDINKLNDLKNNEKVVVQIKKWNSDSSKDPEGVITESLGKSGSQDIDMKSILINNGFQLSFDEATMHETEAIPEEITQSEIDKRRDYRKVLTLTIDPDDAKDFDDALSLLVLENGNLEIGVHIADVSHYVKPGSMLDKEAAERSTSVYLVDRVLPMLPEKLSNGVCSLRPNEDKLCFSAIFEFNKDKKIVDRWFGKTVIHSDKRFTYNEAFEALQKSRGKFVKELKQLNEIAKNLRDKRMKQGSIAFETDEIKFKLDEQGNPIELYVKERTDSHLLVEDFMLLANKEVAKFIDKKAQGVEIPFVYRVHDMPDPEKLHDLALMALEMGIKTDFSTPKKTTASINKLLKTTRENEDMKFLEPLAIRSMAKAAYAPDNIGHYGLGFSHYSHFTSPIRRYSDVLAHRILEKNLTQTFRTDKGLLDASCKHISSQERKAIKAERESNKYMQVKYITDHIGEKFDAIVTGMIDKGIFVEIIENKVEGLIPFSRFGEKFKLVDSSFKAVAKKSATEIRLGDRLRVKVIEADLITRRIEMEPIDEDSDE